MPLCSANEICSCKSAAGDDDLGEADAVIRDIDDFNQVADAFVVVDGFRYVVNQADDFFRHVVGGCGFTGKDEDRGCQSKSGFSRILVVAVDDVHHVQRLALVFVDAFDLDVKQRVRVNLDAQPGFDVFGEAFFGGFFSLRRILPARLHRQLFSLSLVRLSKCRAPVLFARVCRGNGSIRGWRC